MKTIYYFLAVIILMVCACEEKKLEPVSGSLGKPGMVTILDQEAIPGGVTVTYRIPDSEDILSVKAVYTLSGGRTFESSASFYENTLTIAGFNDMAEHEAKIYTINRAQVMSDPVIVKFTPLEASFIKTAKTMKIISDFGGARFTWKNTDKAPLTFEFYAQDSVGSLQAMRIITSEADSMRVSLRGYEPAERRFGAVVRDYWNNEADTVYSTILPLFEEKIPKSGMSVMKLSNDANFTNWEGMDSYLIDDDIATFGHSPNSSIPAPFTIDLGKKVKLSRVVLFNRNYNNSYYSWGNPKTFDVYGCFTTPSTSGNWDEWTKLMECTQVKPSGSPGITQTDEDLAAAEAGFEFEFDLNLQPIRYVRIVVKSTWESSSFSHPAEIDFYGEMVE